MRLKHPENFCSEDRFWPKHHAARRVLPFLSTVRMLLRIQTGKHQLRKNPLLLAKEVVIPECQTSALTRMTRSGVTVRLLQLKVNRINSVFNPVSPLTVLWQNWSSKHKDLENEKHFPEKKKKEEETKSYKQGEQRSYVSILSVSKWPFTPGCQGNKSTPQARSIIPNYPLLQWKGESHTLAKACHSEYDSKLLLRKVEN